MAAGCTHADSTSVCVCDVRREATREHASFSRGTRVDSPRVSNESSSNNLCIGSLPSLPSLPFSLPSLPSLPFLYLLYLLELVLYLLYLLYLFLYVPSLPSQHYCDMVVRPTTRSTSVCVCVCVCVCDVRREATGGQVSFSRNAHVDSPCVSNGSSSNSFCTDSNHSCDMVVRQTTRDTVEFLSVGRSSRPLGSSNSFRRFLELSRTRSRTLETVDIP